MRCAWAIPLAVAALLAVPLNVGADSPPAFAPGSTADGYPPTTEFTTDCSNKCTSGRGGNAISHVVFLSSEGGKDATIATWQFDSGKSIHYFAANDGSVAAFVPEADTAWYACDWPYNQTSIGVIVEGFVSTPSSFGDLEYQRAAQLVAAISHRYQFPIDASHVIARGSIPNTSCTGSGPDPAFDLTRLRTLAQQYRDVLDPPPAQTPATTDTTSTTTPPPDTTPPAATLSGATTQKLGSAITVVIGALSEHSTAAETGIVRIAAFRTMRARTYRLRATAVTLAAGSRASLLLRVPAAMRTAIHRALRAHRRVTATLTFVLTDDAGNRTTLTRRVKLT